MSLKRSKYRRARRELRTDRYYLKPPLPVSRRAPDNADGLRQRVAALEQTIVEIGHAAAEVAEAEDDIPAIASGVIELAKQLDEFRARLESIEGQNEDKRTRARRAD